MNEPEIKYVVTSDSSEYESWEWYREYQIMYQAKKRGDQPSNLHDYGGGPMPVQLGIDFSCWVMRTPEIRDIVYRRFIEGDYNNTLEGNLLSDSTYYFLSKERVAGVALASCWIHLAKVLRGEIESVNTSEYRASLLKSKYAFTE